MTKYTKPELDIRYYKLNADYITTSTPDENEDNDLLTDDKVDYVVED